VCIFLFTDFNKQLEKYADEDNPLAAFAYLFSYLSELFQHEDFTRIKRMCLLRGVGFSPDFREKMKAATNTEEVLDVLDDYYTYCNWLNVRYLKIIVKNARMSIAEQLIDIFEKHFYSKKVSKVKEYIDCRSFDPKHVKFINVKINVCGDQWTVKELIKFCRELENMGLPEGSTSPADSGQPGCLLLACAIPLHCLFHAYEKIKLNSFKLRELHIQYIEFVSYPKIFPYHIVVPEKTMLTIPSKG